MRRAEKLKALGTVRVRDIPGGGERGGFGWPIRDRLSQRPEKSESAMSAKQKSKLPQLTAQGAIRYLVAFLEFLLNFDRGPAELLQLPVRSPGSSQ